MIIVLPSPDLEDPIPPPRVDDPDEGCGIPPGVVGDTTPPDRVEEGPGPSVGGEEGTDPPLSVEEDPDPTPGDVEAEDPLAMVEEDLDPIGGVDEDSDSPAIVEEDSTPPAIVEEDSTPPVKVEEYSDPPATVEEDPDPTAEVGEAPDPSPEVEDGTASPLAADDVGTLTTAEDVLPSEAAVELSSAADDVGASEATDVLLWGASDEVLSVSEKEEERLEEEGASVVFPTRTTLDAESTWKICKYPVALDSMTRPTTAFILCT